MAVPALPIGARLCRGGGLGRCPTSMSDVIVKVGVRVVFPVASLCAAVEVALRKMILGGPKQSRRLARLGRSFFRYKSNQAIIRIKRESLGLCRFGEAWAALRAKNLLTY